MRTAPGRKAHHAWLGYRCPCQRPTQSWASSWANFTLDMAISPYSGMATVRRWSLVRYQAIRTGRTNGSSWPGAVFRRVARLSKLDASGHIDLGSGAPAIQELTKNSASSSTSRFQRRPLGSNPPLSNKAWAGRFERLHETKSFGRVHTSVAFLRSAAPMPHRRSPAATTSKGMNRWLRSSLKTTKPNTSS